jgi:8-oxo-dGTP pyrophosphatase MutT (NUDIX family)
MKETTFAVFFTKREFGKDYLLMAHSTGNTFWDVPKGGAELDETPVNTAIREVFEEIGYVVKSDDLKDFGLFTYNSQKNMQVFVYQGTNHPVAGDCVCTSTFTCPHTGRERPEVDAFEYVEFSEVPNRCAKSFNKVWTRYLEMIK